MIKRLDTRWYALGLILTFCFLIGFGQPTLAQDNLTEDDLTGYELLAPLPEVALDGKETTAIDYIPGIVKLLIGVATALAVLQIIIGGIQYMTTDAFSGKSSAKDTIQNAIIGLFLAMGAYLILYTINPRLVQFNLQLDKQDSSADINTGLADTESGSGDPWESDDTSRETFEKAFIDINRDNCTTVGQTACTSLQGISSYVFDGLKKLKDACKCAITVTGGTEYWLHGNRSTNLELNPTAHRPGGRVVDLSLKTPVTEYLRAHGTKSSRTDCVNPASGAERYEFQGGLYVNETINGNDPHWHVCF